MYLSTFQVEEKYFDICEKIDDLSSIAKSMVSLSDHEKIDKARDVVKELCSHCENDRASPLCTAINHKSVDPSTFQAETCNGKGSGKDCNQPSGDEKNTKYCQDRKKNGLEC